MERLRDRVAVVTLMAGARRNALTPGMARELITALDRRGPRLDRAAEPSIATLNKCRRVPSARSGPVLAL